MTRSSISFDRIADRYEQHRGGVERGDRVAGALRQPALDRLRALADEPVEPTARDLLVVMQRS